MVYVTYRERFVATTMSSLECTWQNNTSAQLKTTNNVGLHTENHGERVFKHTDVLLDM